VHNLSLAKHNFVAGLVEGLVGQPGDQLCRHLNVFGNKNGLIVGVLDELSCKLAVCNIASVYSAIAGDRPRDKTKAK
jgi:hypothetical protein